MIDALGMFLGGPIPYALADAICEDEDEKSIRRLHLRMIEARTAAKIEAKIRAKG